MKNRVKQIVTALALLVFAGWVGLDALRSINQGAFYEEQGRIRATRAELRCLRNAMNAFAERFGRWPQNIEEVWQSADAAIHQDCKSGAGSSEYQRFISSDFVDVWGHLIELKVIAYGKGQLLRIASGGPNGKIDDGDDIIIWWPASPDWLNSEWSYKLKPAGTKP